MKNPNSIPKAMEQKYREVTELIEDFCRVRLNEEYTAVCSKLCAVNALHLSARVGAMAEPVV